ncbi:MAG: hypothetical protein K8L97_25550 [Anaerolineae bacterium]|nr:hypothetical protein [Anaerolineae bacterium]
MNTEISQAIDQLKTMGFVVRCDETEDCISGGFDRHTDPLVLKLGGLVDGFSIQLSPQGSWVVHKRYYQLMIKIPYPTLLEAVNSVQKLYEISDGFDDSSITSEEAVRKLKLHGLNSKLVIEKKLQSIDVCFDIQTGGDCIRGLSICRKGGYFIIIKYGDRKPSVILHCAEKLIDAVDFLIALNN